MVSRTGVSARAFHEIFESDADCFAAAFEEGLARVTRAVGETIKQEENWLEHVRAGLVALLGFLDDEPHWGRLLVLEAPRQGTVALGYEQRLLTVLTRLLNEGAPNVIAASLPSPQLMGELVAGGVFAVIRTRMLEQEGTALVELAPSLTSFVVTPYLGHAATRAEFAGSWSDRNHTLSRAAVLPIRPTRRTALVLRAIVSAPRSNNREIAEAAGLIDEGQTSKLLARLERRGLIKNVGIGAARGEPNAWLLTPDGHRVLELIGERFPDTPRKRMSGRIGGAA